MALTAEASGTQAATITTEHALHTNTGAKSFLLVVDLSVLANGDELELRAKAKILPGGTRKQMDLAVFQHAQADPVAIFGPYPSAHDLEFTLKQTAGTGRAFDWAVWSV
jgi:hypothetical protein